MSNCESGKCTFRQMEENPGEIPEIMIAVAAVLTKDFKSIADIAEDITAMEAPICEVKDCKLTVSSLANYMDANGTDAPRQEFAEMVAPDCSLRTLTSAFEEEVAPYVHPDRYPEGPNI